MRSYKKRFLSILMVLCIMMSLITIASAAPTTQTWTGYITTEDDFAAGLGEDNAFMVYMKTMAMSGIGITYQQNGKWVFLYFDGTISTGNSKGPDGKWAFDGTGSQLKAWNIVADALSRGKYDPVPVTVTGTLNGDTATNPGLDADGLYFPVITVSSMNLITPDQTKAEVLDADGNVIGTSAINMNEETGTASVTIGSDLLLNAFSKTTADTQGVKTVVISIPRVDGAKNYKPTLPASFLSTGSAATQIKIKTAVASVILPGNMLNSTNMTATQNVSVVLSAGDTTKLSADIKTQIGTRPMIALDFMIDGMSAAWNSGMAISVKIPYTRTAPEKADLENIIVWDIDSAGDAIPVVNAKYDSKAQAVTLSAAHVGNYAIVFIKKAFDDIGNYSWASKQISVLAAKGIMNGTSEATFTPSAAVTRAEFVSLLIKTLGLQAAFAGNYEDMSPDALYYDDVGTAKELEISSGDDNGDFNPDANISRQDMMALTERALVILGKTTGDVQLSILDKYVDKGSISGYALKSVADLVNKGLISGFGDKINPLSNASRAEAAVLLYKIYSLYIASLPMA